MSVKSNTPQISTGQLKAQVKENHQHQTHSSPSNQGPERGNTSTIAHPGSTNPFNPQPRRHYAINQTFPEGVPRRSGPRAELKQKLLGEREDVGGREVNRIEGEEKREVVDSSASSLIREALFQRFIAGGEWKESQRGVRIL